MKHRCNGGLRSSFTGISALLPSDVIDFAMLHAQRFWRETVCRMSCDPEVINDSALWGKIFHLYI